MGRVEVQDYVSTVGYLVRHGLTDPDRYFTLFFVGVLSFFKLFWKFVAASGHFVYSESFF